MLKLEPADGRIVFLDTEFTTLAKGHGHRQVWEIGGIVRDPGKPEVEFEWQIRPDLTFASPDSLRIAGYYRRMRIHDKPVGTAIRIVDPELGELKPDDAVQPQRMTTGEEVAAELAPVLDGAYLVGKVPSADELALDQFLPQYGQMLTTFYRLTCVEVLARGYLLGRTAERIHQLGCDPHPGSACPPPPWDTKALEELCGVPEMPTGTAHRALNDARQAMRVWDAVHGTQGMSDV